MNIPDQLRYTEEHEWIRVEGGDVAYVGITDFAQQELGELVYIEVETVGEALKAGDVFGTVEAVKTTSDLYMPVTGTILEFNAKIDESDGDDPTLVNNDPYGEGWIVKIQLADPSEIDKLLTAEAYAGVIG